MQHVDAEEAEHEGLRAQGWRRLVVFAAESHSSRVDRFECYANIQPSSYCCHTSEGDRPGRRGRTRSARIHEPALASPPDVVEVAPAYDHAEITSVAASHVAYDLIGLLALMEER